MTQKRETEKRERANERTIMAPGKATKGITKLLVADENDGTKNSPRQREKPFKAFEEHKMDIHVCTYPSAVRAPFPTMAGKLQTVKFSISNPRFFTVPFRIRSDALVGIIPERFSL